jgi:glycine oxidase
MSSRTPTVDVAVVGGGVIGLAAAWRARQRELSVSVFERGAVGAECASGVAAGMLAPVSEVEFGEPARYVLDLGLRSARMWPDFAADLEEAAGMAVGLRPSGTLLLARDGDEARELERHLALMESLGVRATRLRPSAARELEPALAPSVRLAVESPEDHSVDPRLVLRALRRACERSGVEVCEHAPVASVALHGPDGSVAGLSLRDGRRITAGQVVLAAGAWTGEIAGLPTSACVPVRPLKGQILRLRDRAGPGLLRRVVRFEGGYIVPRGEGRYVLGATVEERGFEDLPTAGGVYELLHDARELVPGVLELQIEELSVGFRPSTPDNAPIIGPGAVEGLVWATGHHRNGILLAPLTAELVASLLSRSGPRYLAGHDRLGEREHALGGDDLGPSELAGNDRALLTTCDPQRFATSPTLAARNPAGPPLGVPS